MRSIQVVPKKRTPRNSAVGVDAVAHVVPSESTRRRSYLPYLPTFPKKPRPRTSLGQALRAINHVGSWVLITTLVASQFTCIFWNSQTTEQYMLYGQDPVKGPYQIAGYNDEPYSDRSLVCMQQGRMYRPMQLSAVLASSKAEIEDTSGEFVSGYRVVSREKADLQEPVAQLYAIACDVIAATLANISLACNKLGYNVVNTTSDLRVVDGVFSNVTWRIRRSLPVLIVPFWDNAIYARYVMPGSDGSACVFHPVGRFLSAESATVGLTAVDRNTLQSKTAGWLRLPESSGAAWRNGWLEDPVTGSRWYSDVGSAAAFPDDKYGMRERRFDLLNNEEVDCTLNPNQCDSTMVDEWWGDEFFNSVKTLWYHSVAISNGFRNGIFFYEGVDNSTIHSLYGVAAMLISNTTVAVLLTRWLVASVALLNAYRRGYSQRISIPGIGCLACTRTFELLPLVLLPRMTPTLATFFTAGCRFEGEQHAISDAWFVIYPAIAEVMLYYYSLLNLLAKLVRRRMSDELFGPSLAFLCLLHWLRLPLANSGLFEFDGRIATVMTAKEYEQLRLVDFFTTDAALRLNGNVWSIFGIKLAVLAVNILPLVAARKTMRQPWPWGSATSQTGPITCTERALGVRASGLGVSPLYRYDEVSHRRLHCYELVRFGYIIFGDGLVVSVSDWLFSIVLGTLLHLRRRPSSFRVVVFRVHVVPTTTETPRQEPSQPHEVREIRHDDACKPTLYPLNSPLLRGIRVWDLWAMPLP